MGRCQQLTSHSKHIFYFSKESQLLSTEIDHKLCGSGISIKVFLIKFLGTNTIMKADWTSTFSSKCIIHYLELQHHVIQIEKKFQHLTTILETIFCSSRESLKFLSFIYRSVQWELALFLQYLSK